MNLTRDFLGQDIQRTDTVLNEVTPTQELAPLTLIKQAGTVDESGKMVMGPTTTEQITDRVISFDMPRAQEAGGFGMLGLLAAGVAAYLIFA